MIEQITLPDAIADAGGDAVVTTSSVIRGRVIAVGLLHDGDVTAATVAVEGVGEGGFPNHPIITFPAGDATDNGWYNVAAPLYDANGAALTLDGTEPATGPVPVWGKVRATIAASVENAVSRIALIVER